MRKKHEEEIWIMFDEAQSEAIIETELRKNSCSCPRYVTAGSYNNQIWVHAPAHMPKDNGYCIDRCIAEEVMSLWRLGITTLGCCCGHNSSIAAYIQVVKSDIKRMKELGYKKQVNTFNKNSFVPQYKIAKP